MLLMSFAIKLGFIVVEVAMAIAFGATEYLATDGYNTSAILEWIVALIFIFCTFHLTVLPQVIGILTQQLVLDVWSYVIDFLPINYARSRSSRLPQATKHRGSEDINMAGGPAFIE